MKPFLVAGLAVALTWVSGTAWACSGGDGCGGPALEWEQIYYMPGEVAIAAGDDLWSPRDGRRGVPRPGVYYLYLRPPDNHRLPADEDPLAIMVGELDVDRRTRSAIASFVVPDVDGGMYYVSICDSGCEHAFGNIYSLPIRIVASNLEERSFLTMRYDDLRRQVFRHSSRAARQDWKLRKQIRRNQAGHDTATGELVGEIVELENQVDRLRARLNGTKPPDQRLPLLTAGGASVLAGLALRRRRRGSTPG